MSVSLLIGISYYLVKLLLAQSILAQDTFVMCLTHHFLKISTSNCCSANKTKMTPNKTPNIITSASLVAEMLPRAFVQEKSEHCKAEQNTEHRTAFIAGPA